MKENSTLLILRRKGMFAVSLNQLIRVLARSQMWIFLPLYLFEIRHIPYITIGIIIFLMAIISLPLTLVSGILIDRKGVRKIIITSNISLIFLFLALTAGIFLNVSVYILYILLIASEPLMNIIGAADNVIVSNSTSYKERNNAFSIVRIFQNVGFSIGPAIGGFIASDGFGYIFLITTFSSIIELSIYIKYLPGEIKDESAEKMEKKEDILNAFKDRPFFIAAMLISLFYLIMGQWGTTLTLFWKGYDLMTNFQIGLLYSVNGIVVTLGQLPVNRVLKRFGDITKVNLGFLLYLSAFSILPFFRGFLFLVIDTLIITIGENVISPSINTIISRISPVEKRGQYFTSFQVMTGFIYPVAPVLGTFLLTLYSKNLALMWYPLAITGTLFFFAFIPLWKKIRMSEHTN